MIYWHKRIEVFLSDKSGRKITIHFSVWNSRLFCVPHSTTMQLQMKSTVAYNKPIPCFGWIIIYILYIYLFTLALTMKAFWGVILLPSLNKRIKVQWFSFSLGLSSLAVIGGTCCFEFHVMFSRVLRNMYPFRFYQYPRMGYTLFISK